MLDWAVILAATQRVGGMLDWAVTLAATQPAGGMLGAGGTCEFAARSECRRPASTSLTGFCACLRPAAPPSEGPYRGWGKRGAAHALGPAYAAKRSQDGAAPAASEW